MISFIVPAHNEEAEIGRTLDSIHAAARALFRPEGSREAYEVIVVDDASTDTTAAIARDHGAKVLRVAHRQIAATRNAGGRAARGERLFFVDADTIITPRLVAAAMGAMDRGAAGGGAPARLDGAVPLYARLLLFWFRIFMRIAELSGGAFMFCTRAAFDAVGGFDERLFGAEDAAMSSALKREGRFALLWEPVLTSGRRVRGTSGLEILSFFVRMAFFPGRLLKRREGVKKIWYEPDRAGDEAASNSLTVRASNLAALVIMVVILTGPLWLLPLPKALAGGPLGTVKYGVQVFQCHLGLLLWPCAYFLLRSLLQQKRWVERFKLAALIVLCVWGGWNSTREVIWIWQGVFEWLAPRGAG